MARGDSGKTPTRSFGTYPTSPRRMMRPFAKPLRYQVLSKAALTGIARTFLCFKISAKRSVGPRLPPQPLFLRFLSGAKQTPPLWLSLLMNWISTLPTLRSNAFPTLAIRRCSKRRALQRPSSRNFLLAKQPCDLAATATNRSLASRQWRLTQCLPEVG